MRVIAKYQPRLEGKKVMLFVGGLRPRHVIGAYEDLGMEVVGTGYEFGHNDDYQRTTHYVKDGTLIYDDVTGYEFEKFVEKIQPDLVGSGIKEKYVFQKMGVPFRQMHSWDYSGPYHGYDGFAIFARDMDMAINTPVWELTKAPWAHDHITPRAASMRGTACGAMRIRHATESQKTSSTTSTCSASRNTRRCSRTRRRTSKTRSRMTSSSGVREWTKTEEYREKNFAREALTVNPAKACQPLGAVFAAVGFEQTLPFVHGSQGCVAYYRSISRAISRSRPPASPPR